MSGFSRRDFLKTTAGAALASNLAGSAFASTGVPKRGGTLIATWGGLEPQSLFVPPGGGSSPYFTSTKLIERLIRLTVDLKFEPVLALDQQPLPKIPAIQVQKIEQEEDERRRVAAVGCQLDDVERGDAVKSHAAQLAVEIGLALIERRHGFGDRRIFIRPTEACRGQQRGSPAVQPRMHAVGVRITFAE